jgi:membrane fusion protein (multidrug efflux system)
VIFLLLIIGGALGYKKYLQIQEQIAMGSMPVPPSSVTVADATADQWQNRLKAIGTLVASQGIDITSEVNGIVKQLNFESGQEIRNGELLLSLNNEIEQAALTTAQAQFESANNQYQRSLKLKSQKFVTENEIDLQRWATNSAKSRVQSAQAALDKKNILVPFSGMLGIRNVDVGDYVSPGTKLVSLQDVDTLYLDFTLPERHFTQIAKQQPVKFKVRSYPDRIFEGQIQAWDPNLDTNTRNVNVRAEVKNRHLLQHLRRGRVRA